jgi:hypothetical protein
MNSVIEDRCSSLGPQSPTHGLYAGRNRTGAELCQKVPGGKLHPRTRNQPRRINLDLHGAAAPQWRACGQLASDSIWAFQRDASRLRPGGLRRYAEIRSPGNRESPVADCHFKCSRQLILTSATTLPGFHAELLDGYRGRFHSTSTTSTGR